MTLSSNPPSSSVFPVAPSTASTPPMGDFEPITKSIRKRDGVTVQSFDVDKIRRAVGKAWLSEHKEVDANAIEKVIRLVISSVETEEVTVEDVQDRVEIALMRVSPKVAKHYIIYREDRAKKRALRDQKPDPKAVSQYIHAGKYARHRADLGRREVYAETVDRDKEMHIRRFPHLRSKIEEAFGYVHRQQVLPSMRSMQFGGKAIEVCHARQYNCCFTHVDRLEAFSQALYLLLCGCGVGYSVQYEHTDKLPAIGVVDSKKFRHHIVEDTIEGWGDAAAALFQGFQDGVWVEFAFHKIRAAGSILKTSGGRAPGHAQLKKSLELVRGVLLGAQGRNLRPIEAHRIMCMLSDAPLSGGIRRCLPAGTLVHTARGLIPIEQVKIGDRARTSGVGHAMWGHISDVIEQGTQSLVHIKTQMGVNSPTEGSGRIAL